MIKSPDTTTIRDIARVARVSTATVSMVLNESSQISEQTRQRVLQIMHKFNYRRKPVGRPRSAPACYSIALVHPSLPSEPDELSQSRAVTLHWLNDIRRQLTVAKHHLCLFGGHKHVDNDLLFCDVTQRHELDGVLLLGARHDGYLDWIQKLSSDC